MTGRRLRGLLGAAALAVALVAGEAAAAWRIGVAALSDGGARAIMTFDSEWVEVDVETGATTLLTPPPTCGWTSAAYGPGETGFALTAHCVADLACHTQRAGVWVSDAQWGLVNVARVFGRRWSNLVWTRDEAGASAGAALVRETTIAPPIARGLGDLGARDACEQGEGRLALVGLSQGSAEDGGAGRVAVFDIAPRSWSVVAPIAAAGGEIIARMRARRPREATGPAEAEVERICAADPDEAADWRAPVCTDAGFELAFAWADGEWRLLDAASDGPGRLVVSADLSTRAREMCTGEAVGRHLKARCVVRIEGLAAARRIEAPEGLFGDLVLSGDGAALASLAAGRGFRFRRFDLFDLATGQARDLSHLLDLGPPWGASR